MILKFKSKISKGDKKGTSSRTAIPKQLLEILNAQIGDSIEWTANIQGDGVTVTVKTLKDEDKKRKT